MPSMVRLMYQLKSVLKSRETMLKNSKVVLFVSPYKVGQAGNYVYGNDERRKERKMVLPTYQD